MRIFASFIILMSILSACSGGGSSSEPSQGTKLTQADISLTSVQKLGKLIFNDTSLSEPAGQGCVSCHTPDTAFTDPSHRAVSPGADSSLAGNRNAPTIMYAAFIPKREYTPPTRQSENGYSGGLFVDGRVDDLEGQAKGPFLNPLEMMNPDKATVVKKVAAASYADQFKKAFGDTIFSDTETAYDKIATALAEYERSDEFKPFTSKYDYYLRGMVDLSDEEKRGLEVFESRVKGNCRSCHESRIAPDGTHPLFTDYGYDNVGTPKNSKNPFYTQDSRHNPDGYDYVDTGLGGSLGDSGENGKFRTPTLRNVALTAPYLHNGVFNTLEEVVDFYNTRDTSTKWAAAEYSANVNKENDEGSPMGSLGLTDQEVRDMVAFLKTLSDGYEVK